MPVNFPIVQIWQQVSDSCELFHTHLSMLSTADAGFMYMGVCI